MRHALRRLVLVRHGETVGQSSVRYHGATDVPLSELGRRQMERVGQALRSEDVDAVYTSALQRAVVAARLVAPGHAPQVVPGFNEINFGVWEGLTREEIAVRDPDLFRRWSTGEIEGFVYPRGDAVAAFRERVRAAWRVIHAAAPKHALVVAHKGVIRTILSELVGRSVASSSSWPIDLASVHVLSAAAQGWVAERANDVGHLEGLA